MFALPRCSGILRFIFAFELVVGIVEVGHDLVQGEPGLVEVILVLKLHSLVGGEGAIRDTLTAV